MDTNEPRETSSPSALIDTHCHLDDEAFAADLADVLAASREAGVCGWLLIGYKPERWADAARMAEGIPGMRHSLGVHPSHAQEWSEQVEASLREMLRSTGAVAVGEFGLDFYRDNAPFEVQREAMVGQLKIAYELRLPAIFHMRNAENAMLDVLGGQPHLPGMVFHSFDGSDRLVDFILGHDAWVGVGGLATRPKSEPLRQSLQRIPLERMILETDAPYLVPARQKDRRNVPAHVRTVAEFLARVLDVPVETIARQTTANAESLFGKMVP